MFTLSDKTKLDIKNELKSILTTFLADFSLEIGVFLYSIYEGNITMAMVRAIAVAALRSFIKAVGIKYFPNAFKYEVKGIAKIR